MNQKLRDKMIRELLDENTVPGNSIYGTKCIARLIFGASVSAEEMEGLNRAAKWFELPHPGGTNRDLKGEPDFVAHKLIRACHSVENKLPVETMKLIHRFFTKWDFESKYKSENHMFLFHESRYLYALKYPDAYFEQYGMSAGQVLEEDRRFLQDFIRFRAQRGWARV